MNRFVSVLAVALGIGVATVLGAAPEAQAHGAACGSACVDADDSGAADDLARCTEEIDSDPSDGICGCIRVPGRFPEGGEPVYDLTGEDHVNAAGISGYADEAGPTGCIDVNGQAGLSGTDGDTDVSACGQTAGLACFENECADIELDSDQCGGDQDCSDPDDPTDANGGPCAG